MARIQKNGRKSKKMDKNAGLWDAFAMSTIKSDGTALASVVDDRCENDTK